jgi:NAD(P)-dependent dehydrogenase (short-subunit alcohol dehydrogenase family)
MSKRVTLIVGGTKGIGSVIKQALIERGDLVYTASRSDLIDSNHFKIDLPNKFAITKVIKFNYLIFAHRYRGNDWDQDFHITVKGVDLVINRLKESFLEEAAMVVLGSNASRFIFKEQSASYHASRAALSGLVKYYAASLGHKKIRCNLVLPGTIIKPENEHFFSEENSVRKMIEQITPLQRMGSAKDVANMVEFLCSEKSSFVTGQSFSIDGGLSSLGQESIARQCLKEKHPYAR